MIVIGLNLPPEYRAYRADPKVAEAVDAIHYARCGCGNWAFVCPDQPEGFFEEAVRDATGGQAMTGPEYLTWKATR